MQHVELKLSANPKYFDGTPQLDGVTCRFIREDSTRLAQLQSGGADVVSDVAFSAIPTIESSSYGRIESVSGPPIYSYALKTKEGSLTADVRVRRALYMAIDKLALIILLAMTVIAIIGPGLDRIILLIRRWSKLHTDSAVGEYLSGPGHHADRTESESAGRLVPRSP